MAKWFLYPDEEGIGINIYACPIPDFKNEQNKKSTPVLSAITKENIIRFCNNVGHLLAFKRAN